MWVGVGLCFLPATPHCLASRGGLLSVALLTYNAHTHACTLSGRGGQFIPHGPFISTLQCGGDNAHASLLPAAPMVRPLESGRVHPSRPSGARSAGGRVLEMQHLEGVPGSRPSARAVGGPQAAATPATAGCSPWGRHWWGCHGCHGRWLGCHGHVRRLWCLLGSGLDRRPCHQQGTIRSTGLAHPRPLQLGQVTLSVPQVVGVAGAHFSQAGSLDCPTTATATTEAISTQSHNLKIGLVPAMHTGVGHLSVPAQRVGWGGPDGT